MNVEIGTETPIFLFWEYLFQIFCILSLQCRGDTSTGAVYTVVGQKRLGTAQAAVKQKLLEAVQAAVEQNRLGSVFVYVC